MAMMFKLSKCFLQDLGPKKNLNKSSIIINAIKIIKDPEVQDQI
jgi:ribosomal protein L20A (L18A)